MGMCLSETNQVEDDVQNVQDFCKPSHYRRRKGPKYRVVNFTQDYEYRKYAPSTWICVRVNDMEYKNAKSKGASLLAKYFKGENGPEKVMNETCPLRIQVEFNQALEKLGYFVVAKHLPYEHCDSPPAPKQKDMFIQDLPEHFAYASVFGGVANESEIKARLESLIKVLENEQKGYEKMDYSTTSFEKFYSLKKQTNEVILYQIRKD